MSSFDKSSTACPEMRILQCTSEVRDKILLFVDQIYDDISIEDPVIQPISSLRVKTKQPIPKLYRCTGIVTMFLCVCGFIFMFIDAVFSILGLGPSMYIIWCLCCLSLYFTNKIALAEWKSINERQRETSQKNHNT